MRKGILGLLLIPILLSSCATNVTDQKTATTNKTATEQTTKSTTTDPTSAEEMSRWTYTSGQKSVKVINNDQPTTIKDSDFQTPHIDYSGLDKLNRTQTATAYLTRDNLGKSDTRTEQTWRPTGWHNQPKYVDGTRVIAQNRGHLIAYTMTFNLNQDGQTQTGALGSIDNPYNLFTQTEYSNQKTMTQTEQLVRDALARNKKVIYQVTPIFRDNELMARGVWVQALSTDGSLKFNRYLWNVQDQIQFNYTTGYSNVDTSFHVPTVHNSNSSYRRRYNYNHYKQHKSYQNRNNSHHSSY